MFTRGAVEGIRWDRNVMTPANESAVRLDADLRNSLEIDSPASEIAMDWRAPGRVVVIDNWRVLHARPPVPEWEEKRTLYRVFATEE